VARVRDARSSVVSDEREEEFRRFFNEAEPRLRRALVAAYGTDRGREATAEALAYAWEHWDRVQEMGNAVGYLYRVGQSRTRPRRVRRLFDRGHHAGDPVVEPALPAALAALSERQRVAVVLVHGFGWTLAEVAEVTGLRVTTVQNHVTRGLDHLRRKLEVHVDG
jgi:DNA-directed RNA polymerase specialized sigma24 family protein